MAQGVARIGKDRYRTEIDVGGHALIADEPPALGGGGVGPAPYDLLLASLGACTAITLRMYADRKGWPLESVEVGLRLSGRERSGSTARWRSSGSTTNSARAWPTSPSVRRSR